MLTKIFINYRRGDEAGFAHALYQRLEQEFTGAALFMDVEGQIKPGDDFVRVIDAQVSAADTFLVVMGPRWSDLLAARSQDPDDFVVIEIRAALEQGKRLIPILVGGASMPSRASLSESIRALARLNAVLLRPERFATDCQGLINILRESYAGIGKAEFALSANASTAAKEVHRQRELAVSNAESNTFHSASAFRPSWRVIALAVLATVSGTYYFSRQPSAIPQSKTEEAPKDQVQAPGLQAQKSALDTALKRELLRRGYESELQVPSKGLGLAILAYEFDNKRPLTGAPTEELLGRLRFDANQAPKGSLVDRTDLNAKLVLEVQRTLAALGFFRGTFSGRIDVWTHNAISDFERSHGIPVTGRLAAATLLELISASGHPMLVG